MIATRQNHTVPMAPSLIGRRVGEIAATVSARLGPHFNLAINQKQPQNGQYRVHAQDRKSTRLNSSHGYISYAVFCLKKKKIIRDSEVCEHTFLQHANGDNINIRHSQLQLHFPTHLLTYFLPSISRLLSNRDSLTITL